ncbi:MAG: hypothetical protein P4L48_00880 [Mycobacterium sp.]|nr:hypothetical protein [Mycobacterium sp.]
MAEAEAAIERSGAQSVVSGGVGRWLDPAISELRFRLNRFQQRLSLAKCPAKRLVPVGVSDNHRSPWEHGEQLLVVSSDTKVVSFNTRRKVSTLGQGPAPEAIRSVIKRMGVCASAQPNAAKCDRFGAEIHDDESVGLCVPDNGEDLNSDAGPLQPGER